jgi:hypothetical protein
LFLDSFFLYIFPVPPSSNCILSCSECLTLSSDDENAESSDEGGGAESGPVTTDDRSAVTAHNGEGKVGARIRADETEAGKRTDVVTNLKQDDPRASKSGWSFEEAPLRDQGIAGTRPGEPLPPGKLIRKWLLDGNVYLSRRLSADDSTPEPLDDGVDCGPKTFGARKRREGGVMLAVKEGEGGPTDAASSSGQG